jgi:hypothetical protein
MVKCPDLLEYLKSLPQKTLEKLYLAPAACLAVLRLVMRLTFQMPDSKLVIDFESNCNAMYDI